MKVSIAPDSQLQRIYHGGESLGSGWDELGPHIWKTLEAIRKGWLGPGNPHRRTGYLIQDVRRAEDIAARELDESHKLNVFTSVEGERAIIAGNLDTHDADHVIYHLVHAVSKKKKKKKKRRRR